MATTLRALLCLVLLSGGTGWAQAPPPTPDANEALSRRAAELVRTAPDVAAGTALGLALGTAVPMLESGALVAAVAVMMSPLLVQPSGAGVTVVALVLAATALVSTPLMALQVPIWDALGFALGSTLSALTRTWLSLLHATAVMRPPPPRTWTELALVPLGAALATMPGVLVTAVSMLATSSVAPALLFFSNAARLPRMPDALVPILVLGGSALGLGALALHAAMAVGVRPVLYTAFRLTSGAVLDILDPSVVDDVAATSPERRR